MALAFKSVDKALVCDHLYESCIVVLSCDAVNYAVNGAV